MSVLPFSPTLPPVTCGYAHCAAANGYIVAVGDDLELPGSMLRVHSFRGSIRVTDCNGAGKRGVRLGELSVETDGHDRETRDAAWRWLASLPLAADFAEAERWARTAGVTVYTGTRRGVDVAPLGLAPVVAVGPRVRVEVDHTSATAVDLTDLHNEPRLLTRNPSSIHAAKARAAIEGARCQIESGAIGMSEVWDLLAAAGFSMHYYCALD